MVLGGELRKGARKMLGPEDGPQTEQDCYDWSRVVGPWDHGVLCFPHIF